jgi:hypothetical protein
MGDPGPKIHTERKLRQLLLPPRAPTRRQSRAMPGSGFIFDGYAGHYAAAFDRAQQAAYECRLDDVRVPRQPWWARNGGWKVITAALAFE